jgi:hypothetical protein
LATDTGIASFVLARSMPDTWYGSNKPIMRLQVRMNSTQDTYVEAQIYSGGCEIGYVLSGAYTRLGAAVVLSDSTGGVWQLKYGTVASTRQFLLAQSGITRCDRTDGGAASSLGASFRHAGFGQTAGVNFDTIFYQLWLPKVRGFAASDRLSST